MSNGKTVFPFFFPQAQAPATPATSPATTQPLSTKWTTDQLFQSGYESLQNKQYPDAYLCFAPLCQKKVRYLPAVQFNLALCYLAADAYQNAIETLDEALRNIPDEADTPFYDLMRTEAYATLTVKEATSDCYRAPMTSELPTLVPGLARERILRLLVDLYVLQENWDEVERLAGGLTASRYLNVMNALDTARSKRRERPLPRARLSDSDDELF